MTPKQRHALEAVEGYLGVANTPLFIVRKIRQDAACREYFASAHADTLLQNLDKAIRCEPKTLRQAGAPYLYAVGLFQKGEGLRGLKDLAPNPTQYPFFGDIKNFLLSTFRSENYVKYDMNMSTKPLHQQSPTFNISATFNIEKM